MILPILTLVLMTVNLSLPKTLDYISLTQPNLLNLLEEEEASPTRNLKVDDVSGCSCKQTPKKYVSCSGCKNFPSSLNFTQDSLKIQQTLIKQIQRKDTKGLVQLKCLEILENVYLEKIQPGSFSSMKDLVNMSISYNKNLKYLEVGTFEGLINLRELALIKNGFDKVYELTLSLSSIYLPKLQKLNLRENKFLRLKMEDFSPLSESEVEDINFELCQIVFIELETFLPLKKLTTLRLGENMYDDRILADLINITVNKNVNFKKLYLNGVGYRSKLPSRLMSVIAKANITTLSLADNQFEVLDRKTFPHMPNLLELDLSNAQVLDISDDTFKHMPKLKVLLLSGNKIPAIPDGVLLKHLRYLDLSSNSGNIYNTAYFSLSRNKFLNTTKLERLTLSYNNIRILFNSTFTGLSNLKTLSMRNASLLVIKPRAFSPLPELLYLDIQNNPILAQDSLMKPAFEGLNKLEILLLGGCGISFFNTKSNMFESMPSLKYLSLERNYLKVISPALLFPLKNLVYFNLAQNLIPSWHLPIFVKSKIKKFIANQNKIMYLTKAMQIDFAYLEFLDLSKNPFSCDCKLYQSMMFSTNENKSFVALIEENPTFCVYPDEYSNKTLEAYARIARVIDLCPTTSSQTLKYVLICCVLLAVTAFFAIAVYKYRWHIRYWIFLTRMALLRNGITRRPTNETPRNYEYDAFVSYSNEDRNFVTRLVAMLENYDPFLKLCVYERDFKIGTVISENVLESLSKSRKTLLIISNSYVQSQWCCWEAQVAENYRLFFQNEYGELVNDTVVMVKLGPVSKLHMTPMLKYLMKTRIYLQWDSDENKQKVFWDKLRKALAPPLCTEL